MTYTSTRTPPVKPPIPSATPQDYQAALRAKIGPLPSMMDMMREERRIALRREQPQKYSRQPEPQSKYTSSQTLIHAEKQRRVGEANRQRMLDALTREMTSADIAKAIGLSEGAVRRNMVILHEEGKVLLSKIKNLAIWGPL